jgi:HSP20 family protein
MGRLHDEMNRLFDRWGVDGPQSRGRGAYPQLNLWEDDENFYVEAEMPGLDLNDLEMFVTTENQLNIKGERKRPEPGTGTWHRRERGYGEFSRTVELPGFVDSEKVTAKLTDGVLTITLPKRDEGKPRRIEVKAG